MCAKVLSTGLIASVLVSSMTTQAADPTADATAPAAGVQPVDKPTSVPAGCSERVAQERELNDAKQLFQKGRDAYANGNDTLALEYWNLAYKLDCSAHGLLYNLAMVYERMQDLPQAIAHYRAFLVRENDIEDRAAVIARVERLENIIEQQKRQEMQQQAAEVHAEKQSEQSKQVASESTASPSHEPQSQASVVPWVLTAAGGVALITGGVLSGIGGKKVHDAKQVCGGYRCGDKIKKARNAKDKARYQAAFNDGTKGRTTAIAGIVTASIGAALIATGVTWYFVNKPAHTQNKNESTSPKVAVGALVDSGTFGLCLDGRF